MGGGTQRLLVAIDRQPDEWIPVERSEFFIGRSRSCDLVLGASQVSRRHCRIYFDTDAFFIEDLKSSSGTYFQKQKLNSTKRIEHGDAFRMGDTVLSCRLENGEVGTKPPLPGLEQAPTIETSPADVSTSQILWASSEPGAWVPVMKDEFIIGRSKSADLRIASPTVSRNHAAIRRTPQGFCIEDLGSASGIRRGDQTLSTGVQRLHAEDEIGIGECQVLIELRPSEDGPPSDAGQRPALIARSGTVHAIENGRITLGGGDDEQIHLTSHRPASYVLGLGRRGGRWVGLLWNQDDPPEHRQPQVVHDGESFTIGGSWFRLSLPRKLPSREAKTAETHAVLRVCYIPGEWSVVDKDEFLIGRSRNCDLVVKCPTVSRTHCKVTKRGAEYFLEDLESAGGIWLGEEVMRAPTRITNHDRFRIGDQTLEFELRP